jgi:tRNA(Arg) A34 adenosine deaminase TadA
MLLHYCSLHTQLFIWKDRAWKDFPLAKINQIRGFCHLLRSANPTSTTLTVIERPCDQCAEAIRQICQIYRERYQSSAVNDNSYADEVGTTVLCLKAARAQSVLRRYPTPGSVTR